jgi:hypothetical protein
MFLERTRAARRAAAASVKLVASASALASFEKVSKESLKADDQSKFDILQIHVKSNFFSLHHLL